MQNVIILFECHDKPGIVAKISNFIFERSGNILSLDQHSTDIEDGMFFMRLEFCIAEQQYPQLQLEKEFSRE